MSGPFTSLGKEVLANEFHYADAADPVAAEKIAAAMNVVGLLNQLWGNVHAPITPSTEGQGE